MDMRERFQEEARRYALFWDGSCPSGRSLPVEALMGFLEFLPSASRIEFLTKSTVLIASDAVSSCVRVNVAELHPDKECLIFIGVTCDLDYASMIGLWGHLWGLCLLHHDTIVRISALERLKNDYAADDLCRRWGLEEYIGTFRKRRPYTLQKTAAEWGDLVLPCSSGQDPVLASLIKICETSDSARMKILYTRKFSCVCSIREAKAANVDSFIVVCCVESSQIEEVNSQMRAVLGGA